jgi:hypothetical protein
MSLTTRIGLVQQCRVYAHLFVDAGSRVTVQFPFDEAAAHFDSRRSVIS